MINSVITKIRSTFLSSLPTGFSLPRRSTRLFFFLGLTLVFCAQISQADNFNSGMPATWHFVDANATGSPWNITSDSVSPMTGGVMTNPVIPGNTSYTQAIQQFDPKTLTNVGDTVNFVIDARTPATQSSGTFTFSMLSTPTALNGDVLGYTNYPLASAKGYTYTQNYNSTMPSLQQVINNVGTTVSATTAAGGVLGNTLGYYYAVTLTKVATGLQVAIVMGGGNGHTTVINYVDTAPPTYTFNTLRIDAGGGPINIDNVSEYGGAPVGTYIFTLPHAYLTSAGVYNSLHQMVRELWKKRLLGPGSNNLTWNGLDDAGNAVPAGTYTIKVLYHNTSYTWEGVIGDTSASFTGLNNTYQSYEAISYMSIDSSGNMYSSVGYNEGGCSIFTASTAHPQSPVAATTPDQAAPFSYVATDGINYYFADGGCGYDTNNHTFIAAKIVIPGAMGAFYTFPNGIDVQTSADQSKTNPHPIDYPSCIDDAKELNSSSSSQPANAFSSGATTITMGSSAGLATGAGVVGSGIATGTTIKSISGSIITLSVATTAAESAENLAINIPQTFDKNFMLEHTATGLAVQRSSSLLAVSHGGLGTVEIFDKTSGELLNTITISSAGSIVGGVFVSDATAPGQVAFAPNGDLWILTGTSAVRYTGVASSSTTTAATTVTGLSAPLAVAVSPVNSDVVAIADGGTSQQVKFYTHTGTLSTTIGQLGGYPVNGPDVSTSKFWFQDMRNNVPLTFLAFQSDSSLWVGDLGNCRALHFQQPSFTTYLGQIATIPGFYAQTTDPNNPTRVFTGHLEYSVDYTKPLLPGDPDPAFGGNGAWKLVKNWWAGINYSLYGNLNNVVTLSNGRTYTTIHYQDPTTHIWGYHIMELPSTANTPARMTTSSPANADGNNIEADGTIRYATPDAAHANSTTTYTQTIYEQALTGFTNNDPVWGSTHSVASTTCQQGSAVYGTSLYTQFDPSVGSGRISARIPKTVSNYYVTYQPLGSSYVSGGTNYWASPNNHLGAIAAGGTNYIWATAPGDIVDVPDGLGTFEDTSSGTYQGYGGHDGIAAFANGHNVIAAYDGQYGYYSNQWMHYYDDGLFVGQFGVTVDNYWARPARLDTELFGPEAVPGLAGNITAASMVNNGGTNYIYCSDESYHAGIHRWRIDGTVNEITGNIIMPLPATGTTINLSTPVAWPATNLVLNPGFECEAATYTLAFGLNYKPNPAGWLVDNGTDGSGAGAFYTEWTEVGGYNATSVFAHSLPYRATIAKSSAFKVRPYQIFTGIPNGTYTLSAWVRSSGGQATAQMYWKQTPLGTTFSGTATIPTTSAWTQISISGIAITGGQAEIGFNVQGGGGAGQYVDIDDVSFSQ